MIGAGADGEVLGGPDRQVGAGQLLREVGAPVATRDDAVEAGRGARPEDARTQAAPLGSRRAVVGRLRASAAAPVTCSIRSVGETRSAAEDARRRAGRPHRGDDGDEDRWSIAAA